MPDSIPGKFLYCLTFTASRYPVRRHVHGVQAVFGVLPDVH
nr:MAG TPA: hypothetical protein [Caudoviricetes sp.]